MNKALDQLNEKIDFLIIGEKATSYKMPLVVEYAKEYEGKICIETKNIRGKYIVFDKETFINAVKKYLQGENNNNNDNEKEKT